MRYLKWGIIIISTFILQRRLSLFGISPDLTVILVYYAGLSKGYSTGIVFGSAIGSIEDSLSGTFLGPCLLSKGLVGYLSSLMSGSFFRWTPVFGAIGISSMTILDNLIVLLSRSFFDRAPASIEAAFLIISLQTLFNSPLGILLKPSNTD
ncbi:MAG: rod shape-determining protein MreD [Thermodesulfovibrionales bacterium]